MYATRTRFLRIGRRFQVPCRQESEGSDGTELPYAGKETRRREGESRRGGNSHVPIGRRGPVGDDVLPDSRDELRAVFPLAGRFERPEPVVRGRSRENVGMSSAITDEEAVPLGREPEESGLDVDRVPGVLVSRCYFLRLIFEEM
jgi:hypothetical protein